MYRVRAPAQPSVLAKPRLQRLASLRAEADRPTSSEQSEAGTVFYGGNSYSEAEVLFPSIVVSDAARAVVRGAELPDKRTCNGGGPHTIRTSGRTMITPISDKDDIVIPATMHIWGFCFSGKCLRKLSH
jgi:hypothetical protein